MKVSGLPPWQSSLERATRVFQRGRAPHNPCASRLPSPRTVTRHPADRVRDRTAQNARIPARTTTPHDRPERRSDIHARGRQDPRLRRDAAHTGQSTRMVSANAQGEHRHHLIDTDDCFCSLFIVAKRGAPHVPVNQISHFSPAINGLFSCEGVGHRILFLPHKRLQGLIDAFVHGGRLVGIEPAAAQFVGAGLDALFPLDLPLLEGIVVRQR